jgi:8-oxo-dGTP diphosphatase
MIKVVGAVIEREGSIFCAKRGPGKALAGLWNFPEESLRTMRRRQMCLQRL